MIRPVHRNMFPLFLQSLGLNGTAVEVGVAEGNYSRVFLDMWPGKYVMVDRWCHIDGYDDVMNGPDEEHEQRHHQAMLVALKHQGRCSVLRMDSVAAAAWFDDRSLDFVYLDGDHSLAGCTRDIAAWAPKVKVGGILAGHDYYDKEPFMVRTAVNQCCNGPCGVTHEPSPSWWVHVG
jgi:Methyltransferase domain